MLPESLFFSPFLLSLVAPVIFSCLNRSFFSFSPSLVAPVVFSCAQLLTLCYRRRHMRKRLIDVRLGLLKT